ncbi:MAG: UDP-N-acetylmuramoyl-tripeptide--D-alanyl-D-alanine ligase [Phycisphaerales bacterium]|nr:UDP-N-acetylmuramoyl-tripeptide--D-alanyl-D-alanine ligase [Phycisphaerales bacterium]
MSGAVASGFWTDETLRAAAGGSWLVAPPVGALKGGAAIDSRAIEPGCLFFALRGDRTDGHRFLREARDSGAAAAVIDRPDASGDFPDGLGVLRVADARTALGRIAAAYRRALGSTRFIAVTGSNGKTTTTRMIHACLAARLRGRCSPKSYNNDLGVPLTILGARPGEHYVVCEVGMNAPGEIEPLSAMIQPDIAVITTVGRAHVEAFGSVEGIAAEKASIASHLAPGGVVVLNADAPALRPWRDRFERTITFGVSDDADLRLGAVGATATGIAFALNGRASFEVPVLGAHNAVNAAAAIAVARRMGVDDDAIRAALAAFEPAEMRLTRQRVGEIEIINDAYNANPDSMLAALRTLAGLAPRGSRRVAVLGDMLELGNMAADAHREVGRVIAGERLADLAVLVGPLSALARETIADAGIEAVAVGDLAAGGAGQAAALLQRGDTVLLKGSRGMRLERVLEALRSRINSTT